MKKRLYLIIVLGCVALILQGCPKSFVRIIYNNSGTDLIVQLEKRQVEWDAGTTIRIGTAKNAIGLSVLAGEKYAFLTVLQGTSILKYTFYSKRGLPSEYVDRSSGKRITKWQIESDNNLYIALPKSTYPVKMPIAQPPGYPLKPVISRSGGI